MWSTCRTQHRIPRCVGWVPGIIGQVDTEVCATALAHTIRCGVGGILPPWCTSMKCGRACSACRDHQNQKCLEKIGSILPPQHSGPILAPALPKAMPARPGRDVREGADDTARDDSGRAIPIVADDEAVSVVDGQPFAARHLADMEKTMHVLYDRLEDLREEVADQKASQSSSKRSKSRRCSRSLLRAGQGD